MAAVREHEFAVAAARERPLLQSTAYLLTGDEERADRLVELVLARRYARGAEAAGGRGDGRGDAAYAPRLETLRELVRTSPHDPMLPWDTGPRVQLVDGGPSAVPGPAIVADLQRLTPDARAVLVLEWFVELPTVQVAAVLGRPVDEVLVLARQARSALSADRPDRARDALLAEELREAVPLHRRQAYAGADDAAHGRHLVRRRWLRRAVALAAAVAVLVAGVVALRPALTPAPSAAPSLTLAPAPTPSGMAVTCDLSGPGCRAEALVRWRAEMAVVVLSHLDPQGRYLTGHGGWNEPRFETPGFWAGDGGALGVEVLRLEGGATTVFLQIATGRSEAVACGATTGHGCYRQKFLSGNFFNLTNTVTVEEGMEVQYRPTGQHVITVIARNTGRGPGLDIPRGDLIRLVQDPRLRLPAV